MLEEKELIDRIRDGDKDSFIVFVDKYKKKNYFPMLPLYLWLWVKPKIYLKKFL